MSQQVNKDRPASIPILQGHKRLLDVSTKPHKEGSSWPLKSSLWWKISNIYKRRENCIIYHPVNLSLSFDNYQLKANRVLSVPLFTTTTPNNFKANSRCRIVSPVNISVIAPWLWPTKPISPGEMSFLLSPMLLRTLGQYLHLSPRDSPWVRQAQELTEFCPKSVPLLREEGACTKCHAVVLPHGKAFGVRRAVAQRLKWDPHWEARLCIFHI